MYHAIITTTPILCYIIFKVFSFAETFWTFSVSLSAGEALIFAF